jgi:hypothetical protein
LRCPSRRYSPWAPLPLIGNAAAALQGSPVTTLDLDFMFRKTRTNLRNTLLVASLRDVIRSKKAAGGPQDLAVVPVLQRTLDAKEEA